MVKIKSLVVATDDNFGIEVGYDRDSDDFIFSNPDNDEIYFTVCIDKFGSFLDALDLFREWL